MTTDGAHLKGGIHQIRISYFQGPRTESGLILGARER